jgi:uncharacterized YkwD family protein
LIKSKKRLLAAPLLLIGLAACTNHQANNSAMDNTRDDSALRNVSYNENNIPHPYHRGVITNNQNDNTRFRYQDRLVGVNISAMETNQSSTVYPHTRAMLIQEAKYKAIPLDPNDALGFNIGPLPGASAGISPGLDSFMNQKGGNQTGIAPNNGMNQSEGNQANPSPKNQAPSQSTASIGKVAQQVIDLTNQQRKQNGLPALKADTQLSGVANKKANDMEQNHYFSHTSPTYGSPFDMMRDFGVSYKSAGENIAEGQQTAQDVVNAWMNSEGHRKNILNPDFTNIGVGFDNNGNYWSQMFIGK